MVRFRVLIIIIIANFIHHCFSITIIDIANRTKGYHSLANECPRVEHVTKSGMGALLHNHANLHLQRLDALKAKNLTNKIQRNRQRLRSPVLIAHNSLTVRCSLQCVVLELRPVTKYLDPQNVQTPRSKYFWTPSEIFGPRA